MRTASGRMSRKDRVTLAILGGLAALGTISCTGYVVEPIDWALEGTAYWAAPLYRDPAEGEPRAKGHVVVSSQKWVGTRYGQIVQVVEKRKLLLSVRGLQPRMSYSLTSPGWPGPLILTTNPDGVLNIGPGRALSVPAPGNRIALSDLSGNLLLAGAAPDWKYPPGGSGPMRADFASASGGETVEVRGSASSRTGEEHLEFRLDGFEAGASADLLLDDATGVFVPSGTVVVGRHGKAALRWSSWGSRPLPLGAIAVHALEGSPFQVRVGAGTVVEGEIP